MISILDHKNTFPDPNNATQEGLLAIGGDLSPERVLKAYAKGIFPWYSEGQPILWWSPNPRLIMKPNELKVSKSLQKTIDKKKFQVTFDKDFISVIEHCSAVKRKGQDETWITQEMIHAFIRLHHLGFAHSVETYYDKKLVGGLYGLSIGKAFFGESMFHKMNDASKVAYYYLVQKLISWDFLFIDAQVETDHLISLGAKLIHRNKYLEMLTFALDNPTQKGKWTQSKSKTQ